jgi:FHA domain-containing protein/von Willebrand factor type A domain-containing protein
MPVPFRIHGALEHQNVEPGRGKIWGVIKIEAHGPALEAERAPLAVVLAVDVSGSMKGEPLEHALHSCRLVSDRLGPSDQLALVTFSDHGSVVCGLTPVDATGRAQIGASLRDVRAQSQTNLHDGLGVAAAVLQRAPAGLRRAIAVLSDGKPNLGLSSPAELATYVRGLGIAVSSLGFGSSYDEDVLEAIASAGSGRYRQVANPSLARADLAQAVLAQGGIVADHLSLQLRPGEGVEVVGVLPVTPLRFGGQGARLPVDDVFQDEARTIAVELEFNLQSATGGRLLELTAEGCSPDGTRHQASIMLEVDVRAGVRIANRDAQRELVMLQGDAARSEARRRADAGSTPTAVAILQEMLARIDALPGFVPNDGSLLAELREQIHDESASHGRRATHAERSHQRKAALAYKPGTPAFARASRVQPAIHARLVGVEGPVGSRSYTLWSETIIGRSRQCDIALPTAHLSRNHARIQFLDDHFLLVDLGGPHGSFVNGQAVQSARLVDGDLVRLGDATFRFKVGDGSAQLRLPRTEP